MTVYIVQDQKSVDRFGQLSSKFDFSSAEKYGELRYILKPSSSPFDLESSLRRIHRILSDFTEEDYLVLTGSPVLLGLCVAIAADYTDGNVSMLQWSGAKQSYIPVVAEEIFNSEKFLQ